MLHPLTKSTTTAAVIAAVGLPLLIAPSAANASETAVGSGYQTVSCSYDSGGFQARGEAEVRWSTTGSSTTVTVERYRIGISGAGGSKANVNVALNNNQMWKFAYSPDAMKQDNTWHDLGLTNVHNTVQKGYVEFVFDRSGSDPKCEAVIPL